MTFSAPGRCGILGNPTDIYGGRLIAASIPARNVCRITDGDALPDDLRLWSAATARFPLPGPVRVEWTTGVPRSSGLAGSTAMLAATLAAVLVAGGRKVPDAPEFGELVRDVERREAGIVCGYQDAAMVVRGGLRLLDFAGKHPATDGGPLPTEETLDLPLPFLLVTTDVERLSGSVHGPMVDRWLAGERSVRDAMTRIAGLVDPGLAAWRSGDWRALGAAMTENHALVRDLGGSGEPVERLISRCLAHGAVAAKLAGAGMGGTVIALTEDPLRLRTGLAGEGYRRFLVPTAGEGLRREFPSIRV